MHWKALGTADVSSHSILRYCCFALRSVGGDANLVLQRINSREQGPHPCGLPVFPLRAVVLGSQYVLKELWNKCIQMWQKNPYDVQDRDIFTAKYFAILLPLQFHSRFCRLE